MPGTSLATSPVAPIQANHGADRRRRHGHSPCCACSEQLNPDLPRPAAPVLSLLLDVIADLPKGIAVVPVFAADKHEGLKAAKELFPGHRVTVVLKEGEPGT